MSEWTVETLREYLQTQIDDLRGMLDERYQTQTKAVDAAFSAQQLAMQTALTAAEKAVQTALNSAEKAVNKAELAADKRFEATNEFRAQLNDQTKTFVSRAEADARFNSITEKVAANGSRLDLIQGRDTGAATGSGDRRAVILMWVAIAGLAATIIGGYIFPH